MPFRKRRSPTGFDNTRRRVGNVVRQCHAGRGTPESGSRCTAATCRYPSGHTNLSPVTRSIGPILCNFIAAALERELLRRLAMRKVCIRALFAFTLPSIVAACGSGDRAQPTAPSEPTVQKEIIVHNTLNRADDRSLLDIVDSYDRPEYIPMISTLLPFAFDDFTSAETTTIRTISWQGGYCRKPNLPGAPSAVSTSFRVWFDTDHNGLPWIFSGYAVTFTPAEAHEQFAFGAKWNEFDCAYYDYTAVLPTPFPVTAATRYWLGIRATTDVRWGWRLGSQDNGVSALGTQNTGAVITSKDLAFSLSSR